VAIQQSVLDADDGDDHDPGLPTIEPAGNVVSGAEQYPAIGPW
jgi:hypothetical protein